MRQRRLLELFKDNKSRIRYHSRRPWAVLQNSKEWYHSHSRMVGANIIEDGKSIRGCL